MRAHSHVNRQRVDLASLQHNKQYQDLDQNVQKLINSLSQGPKNFEELKDLIQNENEKTRDHVSNELQEHERRKTQKEYRTRLLKSLWFAEILSREETIADAHSKTFQWIFDKSGHAVRPWNNFIAWLEKGEGTYWINGKAGSGKSTLMNFLCQNERTKDALTTWSGRKDILMPKFFFWSGGTTIQKSFEGLMRSLIWQILNEFPEIGSLLNDVETQSEQRGGISREHGFIGAWTKRRLQRTLENVVGQLQSLCCFCFFIDGLDEFDEDEVDLITFFQDIVSSTGVKVCLSSRPYKVYEDAFGPSAKLRLQDLTSKDIQRYVTDKFRSVPQLESITSKHELEMSELKEQIVVKAEGVFLWVSLAVKDQIRGLMNEDSPEQLQERLACLPNEVEGIYLRMLLQIDKPYRQEASRFLQMALHKPELTILEHALASYKELETMLLSTDRFSKDELGLMCQRTQKRIITTCVGLLEVRERPTSVTRSEISSDWSSEPDSQQLDAESDGDTLGTDSGNEIMDDSDREDETGQPYPEPDSNNPSSISVIETTNAEAFNLKCDFVHRTAVDFLTYPEKGGEFLRANLSPDFDPQVLYVKALLGRLRLLPETKDFEPNSMNIDTVMKEVAIAEDRTGRAQIRLCELIDRTMSVLDHGHSDWHPESHWCTRWGKLAELLVREQDGSCSSTRTSSRSSSSDSFYSTMSKPTIQGNSDVALMESLNFLSFAASHGLSHYVQQMLEYREQSVSSETLDYLLYWSNHFVWVSYKGRYRYDFRQLKVLPEVLRRGGNPNREFFTRPIWRDFLERMVSVCHESHLLLLKLSTPSKFWHDIERDSNLDWAALTAATIAFIEYGADVQAIWTFHFSYTMSYEANRDCSFDMALSPLSATHLCISEEPDFPRIRDMCIFRGALSYSRCTILTVNFHSTKECATYSKQYELSEHESRDFVALFETYIYSRREGPKRVRADLSRQTSEFYNSLDEVRPHISSSRKNIHHHSRRGEQRSEWSPYAPRFQSGTMGLRVSRAVEGQQEYFDALTSHP